MKEGWKEVTIGDLGQVITGNTPPKKDADNYGGSYPFIKPTDMDIDRRYVTSWEENYSEKAFKRYKNSYIPPKATGVVTIGTVGEKMFQADQYCFTNQSVNVVIPSKDYDEDFIFYLLKYNLPKVENANPGTASGRHHVSKSNFCAIKLDVPLLSTQRKISYILSGYDNLIENNLKRMKLLEDKAQLTYEEWFIKMRFPGYETAKFDEVTGLPEGWIEKELGSIIIKLESGSRPKGGINKELRIGIPSVGAESVRGLGKYEYGKEKLIDTTFFEKMRRGRVEQKDILIYKDGAYIGKTSMFQDSFPHEKCVVNEHVFLINSGKTEFQNYLFFTLNRKEYFDKMQGLNSNAAQPGINQEKLKSLQIFNPCNILIEEFSNRVEPNVKLIFSLAKQNHLLREARDILLPRLMSGMIDVEELEIESLQITE